MRPPLARRFGLVLPGAVLLALGLGACGDPVPAGSPPAPTQTTQPTPASAPVTLPSATGAGSDGLTVRYLDPDGTVKTVRVEDFRH